MGASMITQVPELYDGGFWYVVEAVEEPDVGGKTAKDMPSGWCGWHHTVNGVDCVAVRRVEQAVIQTGPTASVGEVVADWPVKPFGRIGGR